MAVRSTAASMCRPCWRPERRRCAASATHLVGSSAGATRTDADARAAAVVTTAVMGKTSEELGTDKPVGALSRPDRLSSVPAGPLPLVAAVTALKPRRPAHGRARRHGLVKNQGWG